MTTNAYPETNVQVIEKALYCLKHGETESVENWLDLLRERLTENSRADALTYRMTEFDVLLDGYQEALQDGPPKERADARNELRLAYRTALLAAAPVEQPAAAPNVGEGSAAEAYASCAGLLTAPSPADERAAQIEPNQVRVTHTIATQDNAATILHGLLDSFVEVAAAFPAAVIDERLALQVRSYLPAPTSVDARAAEARQLASILCGMVEGGSGDPGVIYKPDYEPADGDVYVARAAELLMDFARAASASETGAEGATQASEEFRQIALTELYEFQELTGCSTSDEYRAKLAAMAGEPTACKGKNCGSLDPRFHSAECFEEYEKTVGLKPANPRSTPVEQPAAAPIDGVVGPLRDDQRQHAISLYLNLPHSWESAQAVINSVSADAYINGRKEAAPQPAQADARAGLMDAVVDAAKAVVREALDSGSVHPCDEHDDEVRARQLPAYMQKLYRALLQGANHA